MGSSFEEWERGVGDRIDGNGDGRFYHVYVMENGDKFFSRTTNTVNSVSGKLTTLVAGYITGGTGKFAGMHGNVRGSGNFDLQTGFNELEFNIDYSMGK